MERQIFFPRPQSLFAPLLFLLAATHAALAYDQSLNDCKAVAAQFDNTCTHGDYDTPAESVAVMKSKPFACTKKGPCIPAGIKSGQSTCTWQRKICVTCRVDTTSSSGEAITKIRIQTNNLPDHCVQSTSVKAQDFDYEVPFNAKETHGTWKKSISTQAKLDTSVCRIIKGYDADALGVEEREGGDEQESVSFSKHKKNQKSTYIESSWFNEFCFNLFALDRKRVLTTGIIGGAQLSSNRFKKKTYVY